MDLEDSAYHGSLTLSRLKQYLSTNPSSINAIGGKIKLTPLCAACLGGHLDIVRHLLSCGGDPNVPSRHKRTPLFFITDPQCKASSATRCAIIRELISGFRGLKADLDKPCDGDKNTPLMNAITQLTDKAVVQQLVESGASLTVKHYHNQKTAKELGEEHGLAESLVSKAERDMARGKIIDLVVLFVMFVISYVNNKTVNRVVEGVVKKYYNLSVNEVDIPKDLREEVEPKTIEEFKEFLDEEVQEGKFEKFFAPNDPFLVTLAEKANALRDDPTTDLGKPENIKRLTQLSLYHPVIYCDDSSSMESENRYEYLIELVTRIARIATIIVPDDMAGVDLRFVNNNFMSTLPAGEILQVMRSFKPSGWTKIGTNLRDKILKPLVYDILDQPKTINNPIPFKRPLLVCILTDGEPQPEALNTLRDEIVTCKQKLEAKGYLTTSVMFCINQVGTSPSAEQFLNGLRNEEEIEEVIYCTVGQLDTKFEELKENERAFKLESWLLHLLTNPIMERHE
ncbi:hypothetical protein BYT27DRAFT_7278694 [Phlegmacium glaucopus]|nr:hypothetical protein BYT27DRAFT_7278694 [Phlegmacium glaucopus]